MNWGEGASILKVADYDGRDPLKCPALAEYMSLNRSTMGSGSRDAFVSLFPCFHSNVSHIGNVIWRYEKYYVYMSVIQMKAPE